MLVVWGNLKDLWERIYTYILKKKKKENYYIMYSTGIWQKNRSRSMHLVFGRINNWYVWYDLGQKLSQTVPLYFFGLETSELHVIFAL